MVLVLLRYLSVLVVPVLLIACDSGGNSGGVVVRGTVTYDRVVFSSIEGDGLDYKNTEIAPVRGATVLLLDVDGNEIAAGKTSNEGDYIFEALPRSSSVRVVVLAELVSDQNGSARWFVDVRDNTDQNALYALASELSPTASGSVRNLHAESGWALAQAAYTSTRSAAPFAILDTLYAGIKQLLAVDSAVFLPDLNVFWSENNRPAVGQLADGDISGTFYRDGVMYVLGAQDTNTDEYDQHVILHEWMHFLEDSLSRSDTTGGRHNIVQSLDPRLAFTEGLANAFSGISTGDPIYRDSFGLGQAEDFQFDLELNPDPNNGDNAGWYVEGSIHSFIYDVYDEDNDGVDALSYGLQPIYDALINPDYVNQSSFATIFSFVELLGQHPLVDADKLTDLLASQNINGTGFYGSGENNDGMVIESLPIYNELSVNGGAVEICTTNLLGEFNTLGNRQFLRFDALPGEHIITVQRVSGLQPANPAFVLYRRGSVMLSQPMLDTDIGTVSTVADTVNGTVMLTDADEYLIEIFSQSNVDGTFLTGGDMCFDVSVSL